MYDNMKDLEEFEEYIEQTELEKNILLKIWVMPRKSFRFINDRKYDKYTWVLLVLAGIVNAFDRASAKNSGDTMSIGSIVILSVIMGGLLGWISYYIYGALLSWTGQVLKGKGNTKSIVRMLAHATIPFIASLLALLFQIILFGNELFKSNPDISKYGTIAIVIYFITGAIEVILLGWTFVLCVIGLSEVQKISIGKAIINLLLPVLVIVVPILFVFLITSSF